MQVELDHVYKRFVRAWIVEDFSFTFESNKIYGIKGQNGAGKSTLLKIISGALPSSKGSVKYFENDAQIPEGEVFKNLSYYAAGDDLIEEYTAEELFGHYASFKKMSLSKDEFFDRVDLKTHKHKTLNTFSAGMRQRMALGLCLFSRAELLLLDEPTSYLDQSKRSWFYQALSESMNSDRLIIIASNDDEDFTLCHKVLSV